MATLRSPVPDLGQPQTYDVEMRRDERNLITVSAKLHDDPSQSYGSVLKPDELDEALSSWNNLYFGQPEQIKRDLAATGRVQRFKADLLPSDKTHLKLVPMPPFSPTLNNAPVEDEDLTDEMHAVLNQARASLARGKSISHAEILREFEGD